MHKKLILDSFKKAALEIKNIQGISPSKTKCAQFLSNLILETQDFNFNERNLRELFNSASQNNDTQIKQPEVILGLCKFLGFNSFKEYLESNNSNHINSKHPNFKLLWIGGGFLILVLLASIISLQKECWMIWKETHYEKTTFDAKKIYSLKRCDPMILENFKKITPSCSLQFFNAKNEPLIWYAKNNKGKLTYFTYYGLHPETGKTLKPITKYIIKKYICN
jgi:hypothetical protein